MKTQVIKATESNNEGELAFSYELEDIDYTSSGAEIFNGQSSVLWNNIRAAFRSDLAAMYKTLRTADENGDIPLSYDKVEEMFETHQAKWPEAIFNEDAEYKYIDPLVDDGTDYLFMLQGSKAEQRKWWLYNRFRYIDSKYNAGDALSDYIFIRIYANSSVTITPYADIYPSVKFGSYLVQTRGARNTATTLACPVVAPNDTETWIYSASQLASVGDLSGFKVGQCDISSATRLQSLKVGDSDSNYTNGNLTSLTLGNNTLLQSLDVRNCTALSTAIDISGCTNIQSVYFDGTAVTSVTLPNGGVLQTLHLPSTITALVIRNQTSITDFTCPSLANVTTLWLDNVSTAIDSATIVTTIASSSRVRLIGFSWSFSTVSDVEDVLDALDTMRGLDVNGNNVETAQVSGTIHVTNMTGSKLAELQERYANITYTYDHITSYLYYYNYDGSSLLYTETITDGGDGTYSSSPSRTSTAQYSYTFVGWSTSKNATSATSGATEAVTSDRSVYAAYTATVRTYPVYWYNGSVLMKTDTDIPYGGSGTAPTETPVYNGSESGEWVFSGWSPDGTNITGATSCYAQYYDNSSVTAMYLKRTITTYTSATNTTIGEYAFYNTTTLTSATAPATTVGAYAFGGCTALTTVELSGTSAATIAANAFNGCTALNALIIRSTTMSTLSATSAFTGTKIAMGLGAIYVPSSMVSTYKADSTWSNYFIASIDDYPVTDFSTITDSWSDIFDAEDDGTYTTKYSVGDTKSLTINSTTYYARLVGIDLDTLSDSSGTAKLSWIVDGLYGTHNMNSSNDTTNGWADTAMRTYLSDTVLPLIESTVRSQIKEVTKTYYDYTTTSTLSCADSLWIPSAREIYGGSSYESSGCVYTGYFTSDAKRIKYKSDDTAYGWWLRSAYSATGFRCVLTSGSITSVGASYTGGVALGFCT